jgi:hypothetical protein
VNMAELKPLPIKSLMHSHGMRDFLAKNGGKRFAILDGEVVRHDLEPDEWGYAYELGEIVRAAGGKNGHYSIPRDLNSALEEERIFDMPNPWRPETFNLTAQGRITRDTPDLAARLKHEAKG